MGIRIEISDMKAVDELLAKMPITLREKTLKKAIRKAGRMVAKEASRLAPKPGYLGDIPSLPALNKSIKAVVRTNQNGVAGFIGPVWPQGAHGHLVEYGHRGFFWSKKDSGKRVEVKAPAPFMRPASDLTKPKQQSIIEGALKSEIDKLADKS